MKRIDNRQYKLTRIKPRIRYIKTNIKAKKSRRYDSKLSRRG